MQFFYGIGTSTEIAYYSYIYAKVDSDKYQKVTSFTRVATLSSIFLSSVTGQICASFGLLDYRQLNIISLGSVCLATLVSFGLPKVERTIYFHANTQTIDENSHITHGHENRIKRAFTIIWYNFKSSFSQASVFRWSLWWALGMCGNYQVGNFIQPLWQSVQNSNANDKNEVWNGAVGATSTFAGALLAFAFAYIKLNWSLVGEILLIFISIVDGLLLIAMGWANDIWMAYIGYLLYRPLFQMLITIASFEIARQIKADCCGLVFGVNTFLALAFQTLLTLFVVELGGLEPQTQFVIYGIYSFGIAAIFLLGFLHNVFRQGWSHFWKEFTKEGIWKQEKEGQEEDCEGRQLSLGSAIEASK